MDRLFDRISRFTIYSISHRTEYNNFLVEECSITTGTTNSRRSNVMILILCDSGGSLLSHNLVRCIILLEGLINVLLIEKSFRSTEIVLLFVRKNEKKSFHEYFGNNFHQKKTFYSLDCKRV